MIDDDSRNEPPMTPLDPEMMQALHNDRSRRLTRRVLTDARSTRSKRRIRKD